MVSSRHKAILFVFALVLLTAGCLATSGSTTDTSMANSTHNATGMNHTAGMNHTGDMDHAAMHARAPAGAVTSPGQEAFGAIQEIVTFLENDPGTDWSKVDISALREHLVDMDEVTMRSTASMRDIPGGFEARVTGTGRTVGAIQRMIAAHAVMGLDSQPSWNAQVTESSDGVVLTVTSDEPGEVAHLRGLGFYGVLATGAHHQAHHLAMARGESVH